MKNALIGLLMILSSCAPHKVPVKSPEVTRQTFSYREEATDVFVVYVPTAAGERAAKEELCATRYICTVQDAGRIIYIQRIPK